jgi:putative acetyltransferase
MDWSLGIAENPRDISEVRQLWTEYWESLGLPFDFQDFGQELRTLPGKYSPPGGRLLLVRVDGHAAGTAAFRPLRERACEAKRLYVRSAYRRRGIARRLLATLITEACTAGYRKLYADTLPTMTSAADLYRGMGFVEVGPYSEVPTPDAIYLSLRL